MERIGVGCVFLRHFGVPDKLELVQLDGGEGQMGDGGGVMEDFLVRFARKTEYKVRADGYIAVGGAANGVLGIGMGVPPVDANERFVKSAFEAVLYHDEVFS
jgi:hypothetical protein